MELLQQIEPLDLARCRAAHASGRLGPSQLREPGGTALGLDQQGEAVGGGDLFHLYRFTEVLAAVALHLFGRVLGAERLAEGALGERGDECGIGRRGGPDHPASSQSSASSQSAAARGRKYPMWPISRRPSVRGSSVMRSTGAPL